MAATITYYHSFITKLGNKEIDLDSDTFKVILTSSSYSPDAATHDEYADVTNELATANGYTQNNKTIGSPTWSNSGGTLTWDGADVTWTASGGSITARYAVIFDDTATSDPLVCYILLDNSPADVTATTGNTLTLTWNASGLFSAAFA